MQCGQCQQELSVAEVFKYEEQERELEAFERSLYAGVSPDALEDVVIPDRIGPDPHDLMAGGQIPIPPA